MDVERGSSLATGELENESLLDCLTISHEEGGGVTKTAS